MADIVIQAGLGNGTEYAAGVRIGPVWTGSSTGYVFYKNGTEDLVYEKTTDGGATWGSPVTVRLDTIFRKFSVWDDRWTSGDTGHNTHIVYGASTFGVAHRSLNTSNDSLSTEAVIQSFTDTDAGSAHSVTFIDITKSVGGTLYAAWAFSDSSGTNEVGFAASTDSGASWTTKASPWEAGVIDRIMLMPGNEVDTDDIWAIFWDVSADELDLKVYDASGDSWSTTNISGSMVEAFTATRQFDVVPRHSDGHIIVLAFNAGSTAGTDLLAWDINGAASITPLTNVLTDEAEHIGCSLFIDQNTNDLYAIYNGDPADVFPTALNTRYKISTDGGTTWGSAVQFNADAAAQHWEVWSGCSVGPLGGRFMPVWADTAASPDELITNFDNSIEFDGDAGAGPAGSMVAKVLELAGLY